MYYATFAYHPTVSLQKQILFVNYGSCVSSSPCLLNRRSQGKAPSAFWFFLRGEALLGRAKTCRWQVFVRRRPPKQGVSRTDVSETTMFQGECNFHGIVWIERKNIRPRVLCPPCAHWGLWLSRKRKKNISVPLRTSDETVVS